MNYKDFIAVFCWRDGGCLPGIVESHLRRVTATLMGQSIYPSAEHHEAIVKSLTALPSPAFLRVIRAPELFSRLIVRDSSHGHLAAQLLDDALFVESGLGAAANRRWSAMGDAYRDPGGVRVTSVDHGLPFAIDYDSPLIDVPMKVGEHRNHRFTASPHYGFGTAVEIIAAISDAFELVRSIAPVAAQLVAQATAVLQLRRDDGSPQFFTSASCNTHVGRAILINPHLRMLDIESLANALVHEAIHAILYMFEQSSPLLPRIDPRSPGYLVRSAWTGSELHLHTYLHAAFVWFGLFHFWTMAEKSHPYLAWRVHRTRACSGFLRPAVLDSPSKFRDELADGMWENLEHMVHQVRALSGGVAESSPA